MNVYSPKNFEFLRSTLHRIQSTKIFVRNLQVFMQNKPNFLCFSPLNNDLTQRQTQFKPNSKPILRPKSWAKPIQTQFLRPISGLKFYDCFFVLLFFYLDFDKIIFSYEKDKESKFRAVISTTQIYT